MLRRFISWLFADTRSVSLVAPPKVQDDDEDSTPWTRESFFTTDIDTSTRLTRDERAQLIALRAIPRTIGNSYVLTGDGKTGVQFAQDSNNFSDSVKAAFSLGQIGIPEVQASWYGSQSFIGYQMCAIMAQHWLISKACAIPARDAIRKGFKFTSNDGEEIEPKVLAAIEKANKRYRLNRSLVEFVKFGRVFGIRVALFVVDAQDPEYYTKPFNPDAITPGSYRGISQIDPYWCVPELTSASALDPAALDFYEPTYWIVNNRRIHKSHLVIMRGDEVADILKPTYLYGGVSVPQKIFERVYAAERTANEAPQLALSKRSMIFYTDTAKALANQQKFEERLSIWAFFRDNFGVKVADKDADKVEQHETSLSGMSENIMTQYQIVSAITDIPINKLMGTQISGFSSGEGEAENYHEALESIQVNDMEPLIDRHMVCLIRSEIAPRFDMAPFAVDCTWEKVKSLPPKEAAEVRKLNAEADKILAVDIGAVTADEVRAKEAADEESGYNGLPVLISEDPQDVEDPQANGQA